VARLAPIDPVRRLLARFFGRGPVRGAARADPARDRAGQSPEQRLLDVVARHGRIGATEDGHSRQVSAAAAAGVRTVAPTEPSDDVAPAWVRRMAGPGAATGEPAATATDPAARPQGGPRRPRRP
jgi:hypothetical protein